MEEQTHPQVQVKSQPARKARPNYFLVLVFLVVFTAVEVAVSYLNSGFKVPLLLILAFSKASLVILYFMHLRYDSRVYAYWFLLGLALIIPLAIVLGLANPGT
jgi:cytochrome c oxidase subunit IV